MHRTGAVGDLMRFVTELIGRIDGPMQFRIYLQPLMALALAARDAQRDAQEGRPPYGFALLTDPAQRRYLLRDGWKRISRVFLLAYVLDLVYQYKVLHAWRPLEALFTALLLALIPYVLLRGPIRRLLRGRP